MGGSIKGGRKYSRGGRLYTERGSAPDPYSTTVLIDPIRKADHPRLSPPPLPPHRVPQALHILRLHCPQHQAASVDQNYVS